MQGAATICISDMVDAMYNFAQTIAILCYLRMSGPYDKQGVNMFAA